MRLFIYHKDEVFVEAVDAIEGLMWAFLEKKEYWRGATRFFHADNVSASNWRKRNDMPKVQPNVDDEDIDELAELISDFFSKKEGRGKNCKVEPYRRN